MTGILARLALLGVLAAAGCVATPTPGPTEVARPTIATPMPTASPDVAISCVPDPYAGNIAVVGDPCPGAIAAVRAATARLGAAIHGIVLRPGPFDCGVIWPGVQSAVTCFGPIIIPGRAMHGWVAFVGTDRVAAVSLWRDLPTSVPISTQPPWTATVTQFAVPPPGWQLPSGSE
jgi:hypothetical protein